VLRTPEFDLGILTPYPDSLVAVRALLTSVQTVLRQNLVAIWFDGSLALGDFAADRSDIDLVVVCREFDSPSITSGLHAAHVRNSSNDLGWGDEIETIYVTEAALSPAAVRSETFHMYVERGTGGDLREGRLDPGWLVHLRVLREHGICIAGSAPNEVIGSVSDDDLREVARWSAQRWLTPTWTIARHSTGSAHVCTSF
jgi:hypothetical protein